MSGEHRWSRILFIAGTVAMVLGALDPLEGSLVVLAGSASVALGAFLSHSHDGRMLRFAFLLVLIGVSWMWALSAVGGFGGSTGRSMWWALTILPYPVGWLLGLVTLFRHFRHTPPRLQH